MCSVVLDHCLSFFFWPLYCLCFFYLGLLIITLISSNFSNCVPVKLTQWQIYLKYLYVYLSISFSLPWNSIHSDGLRTFPVHKVPAPGGMLWQLTIGSVSIASCPDLEAQHLWASNHVSPSLKKSKYVVFFLFVL